MHSLLVIFVVILVIIVVLEYRPIHTASSEGYASESDDYIKPIILNNIVTPQEANHIIEKAIPLFKKSNVLGGFVEDIRKSETAWLKKDDPIVRNIFQRLSESFDFAIENTEDLQDVRYEPGGFYNEHHDSCCDDSDHCRNFVKKSGQRVLTILIYLNDEFEDGHTDFPNLGISLKAEKYGGIVFRPLENGGKRCHPHALHKGTPVTSGVKYICNVWVREKKF